MKRSISRPVPPKLIVDSALEEVSEIVAGVLPTHGALKQQAQRARRAAETSTDPDPKTAQEFVIPENCTLTKNGEKFLLTNFALGMHEGQPLAKGRRYEGHVRQPKGDPMTRKRHQYVPPGGTRIGGGCPSPSGRASCLAASPLHFQNSPPLGPNYSGQAAYRAASPLNFLNQTTGPSPSGRVSCLAASPLHFQNSPPLVPNYSGQAAYPAASPLNLQDLPPPGPSSSVRSGYPIPPNLQPARNSSGSTSRVRFPESLSSTLLPLHGDDDPYILKYEIMGDSFRSAMKSHFLQTDSTHKINHEKYPLVLVGTFDRHKIFHFIALALIRSESQNDYEFIFSAIKDSVEKISGALYLPRVVVADGVIAIRNAAKSVFKDVTLKMCCAHMSAVEKKVKSMVESVNQKVILEDRAKYAGFDKRQRFPCCGQFIQEVDMTLVERPPTIKANSVLLKKYKGDLDFVMLYNVLREHAFVPVNNVVAAYEDVLQEFYKDKSRAVADFLDYFEITWTLDNRRSRTRDKPRFDLTLWNCQESVLNGMSKANNSVEGWHNGFAKMVGESPSTSKTD
ncbi:hypothetical protein DMENIID0001_140470 [Sergentomyia squamirostris]